MRHITQSNLFYCRLQQHNGDKLSRLHSSSPTDGSMASFDEDEKIDILNDDDDDDMIDLDDSRSSSPLSPHEQSNGLSPT